MEEEFTKAVYDEVPNIKVPKKCCKDCFLFPNGPLSKEEEQKLLDDLKSTDRALECIQVTVARRCGHTMPDSTICCYGLFYNYNQDIPILKAALEGGKVEFIDLGGGLPTLATTGFTLWADKDGKKWQ